MSQPCPYTSVENQYSAHILPGNLGLNEIVSHQAMRTCRSQKGLIQQRKILSETGPDIKQNPWRGQIACFTSCAEFALINRPCWKLNCYTLQMFGSGCPTCFVNILISYFILIYAFCQIIRNRRSGSRLKPRDPSQLYSFIFF